MADAIYAVRPHFHILDKTLDGYTCKLTAGGRRCTAPYLDCCVPGLSPLRLSEPTDRPTDLSVQSR